MSDVEFPSYWIEVAGLNIHFKCLGEGFPVILLHGGGNDWHEWKENISEIARLCRVYAMDLPGFGLSQAPTTSVSPSWSVSFLKKFMENLRIREAYFIGHSMGAMIGINFCASNPESVRKLVIVDSAGLGELSQRIRLLLSLFKVTDKLQGKKRGPRYLTEPIEDWMVLELLHQITCPVLVVWGKKDIYLPVSLAEYAHSSIPGCQLAIFPTCGHAPQRECPKEFNRLVLQFLNLH
jgi:2-hydroxy-6-oxonona-2,4-dienedioate hydrolase